MYYAVRTLRETRDTRFILKALRVSPLVHGRGGTFWADVVEMDSTNFKFLVMFICPLYWFCSTGCALVEDQFDGAFGRFFGERQKSLRKLAQKEPTEVLRLAAFSKYL
jgi:hypothetical protein